MYRSLTLVLTAVALAACGGADSTTGPNNKRPAVATIDLTPSNGSVSVGETLQLTATPRDANGVALSGRTVSWTANPSNIAAVSSTGLVTGAAQGQAVVTATCEGQTANTVVRVTPPTVTLAVQNQLIGTATVFANGTALGNVAPSSSAQFQVQVSGPLAVSWSLVKPTTTQGTPVGEDMSGSFNVVSNPLGTISYTIDNLVGTQYYFAPLVSNFGSTILALGVNMGLVAENRCNCTVSPGQSSVFFGYYRLYSNSNVRAYRSGSGYTGTYIYWDTFASNVAAGSGALSLSTSLSLSIGSPAIAGTVNLSGAPVPLTDLTMPSPLGR